MKLFALRMTCWLVIKRGLLASLLLLASCQDGANRNRPDGPIFVKIPVLIDGSYQLDLVQLDTLQDLVHLRGAAARFLFSPSAQDGQLIGYEPRIRTLRTSQGYYVATDSLSLQMLSLYAHFEGLMKLDDQLGVKNLNIWPRPIAVNARVIDGQGQTSNDNARYSGPLDAFLFEPFSREDLPLTINAGVIGHEHFHSLFYKLVLEKLGGVFTKASNSSLHDDAQMARRVGLDQTRPLSAASETLAYDENQIYQLTLMRGINEGMADVWGWIYSGDTDFVHRSLNFEITKKRNLKIGAEALESEKELSEKLRSYNDPRETLELSYDFGSKYAKILFRLVMTESERTAIKSVNAPLAPLRMQLAKAVLRSLSRFAVQVKSQGEGSKLSTTALLEILSEEIPFMNETTCQVLKDKVPDASKGKICRSRSEAALKDSTEAAKKDVSLAGKKDLKEKP